MRDWLIGFVCGAAAGLSLGAIVGYVVFVALMCAPYSGCR